jgi:hypothetical protein
MCGQAFAAYASMLHTGRWIVAFCVHEMSLSNSGERKGDITVLLFCMRRRKCHCNLFRLYDFFFFLLLLGEWTAPLWKHHAWLLFQPRLSLCCSDTYKRFGLLSLPLSMCLEMSLVIPHVSRFALRSQAGWGFAFSTDEQCLKLHCWCSWPYLLLLLTGGVQVELFGRHSHQAAVTTIVVMSWGKA